MKINDTYSLADDKLGKFYVVKYFNVTEDSWADKATDTLEDAIAFCLTETLENQ